MACSSVSQVSTPKPIGTPVRERHFSDAASHFINDDIIVRGVATKQAANGDQGVVLAGFGQQFGGRRNLEGSGDADDFNVLGSCSGAAQRVGGGARRRSVMNALKRETTTANFIPVESSCASFLG